MEVAVRWWCVALVAMLTAGASWGQGPLFTPGAPKSDAIAVDSEATPAPSEEVPESTPVAEEQPPRAPPKLPPSPKEPRPKDVGQGKDGGSQTTGPAQQEDAGPPDEPQVENDGCDRAEPKTDEQKKKEKEKKAKKQKELAKARAGAYKPLFYDNDFRYLEDPAYQGYDLVDDVKRLHPLDCVTLDFGGQYRLRYQHENNFRGLGLTGRDDDFLLHRTRLFANGEFGGLFRAYVEYLDAASFYEDFPPRVIEEDRSDFFNLFGDALLWEDCCGKLWARVGRQELLYGNQRVISPLDWANTRRTFEGYKLFWRGEDWDVDAFWTNPITPDAHNFDKPNRDVEFMGIYSVYKGVKDQTLDLYWLRLINNAREFGIQNAFDFDTLAARWQGSHDHWLAEFEGGYQWGRNTDGTNHSAGAWTLGLGYKFDHCWQPTLWGYYDWASGTDALGAGNGWHHQFPLSHKYFGFMDFYGRRNIQSPNLLLTMKPHERLTLLVWYYHFWLQNRNDTPYSVVMTPFNAANAPASRDLGDEIDLLATFVVNARTNILFGYSHFFAGEYYAATPGVPFRGDSNFFYTHFEINF